MSLTATKLTYCCFAKALPLLRLATTRYVPYYFARDILKLLQND